MSIFKERLYDFKVLQLPVFYESKRLSNPSFGIVNTSGDRWRAQDWDGLERCPFHQVLDLLLRHGLLSFIIKQIKKQATHRPMKSVCLHLGFCLILSAD